MLTLFLSHLGCIFLGWLGCWLLWKPVTPEPSDRAFCDRKMSEERFHRSMFSQRLFSAGVKAERMRDYHQ